MIETQTTHGAKNAVYGSDLKTTQILEMADRNKTAKTTALMEHLLFHKVEQLDRLTVHFSEESRRMLSSPERRVIIQGHFNKGKTIVIWKAINGLVYSLYGY